MTRIDEDLLRTIVYLCVEREVDVGITRQVPIGTGFFVCVDDEDHLVGYIATARHVIENAAAETIAIRVTTDGGVIYAQTDRSDWFISDSDDVAVIRSSGDLWAGQHTAWSKRRAAVLVEHFIGPDYCYTGPAFPHPLTVGVGDELVFVGLFHLSAGSAQNLPIARFGSISRMPIEPVRLERTPGNRFEALVYLAETRSWGGHSGSPVFWVFQFMHRSVNPELPGGFVDKPMHVYFLLGVLMGHFDDSQLAQSTGDILGEVRVRANTGIALITPADALRGLLMRDDVVEERKNHLSEIPQDSEGGPTMDALAGGSEFERFQALTSDLLAVPKEDADQVHRGHQE